MTAVTERIDVGLLPLLKSPVAGGLWYRIASRRLHHVHITSPEVLYNDRSRLVFFSDSHRGDGGRADKVAPNEPLFRKALEHYYREGFTYIEVGDGDELWQSWRFPRVRRAYGRIYDLLHRFHEGERLHLILGNHDIASTRRRSELRDGLPMHEGLTLRHSRSNQRIFVVHGHQADFKSDRMHPFSRFAVRHLWPHLQRLGIRGWKREERYKIEKRIIRWADEQHQAVICGHTHRPMSARYGEPAYFNTGSCLTRGLLSGLEIVGNAILPIRWLWSDGQMRREQVGPARRLRVFA